MGALKLVGRPGFEPGTNRLKVIAAQFIWTSKRLYSAEYFVNCVSVIRILGRSKMRVAPDHLLA